jgi:hypothetical protein
MGSSEIWDSESQKRNRLLEITEEKYGKCWILVLDADEFIKFANGLVAVSLLPDLEKHSNCGIMNVYAYNSVLTLPSIRFIPTMQGVHYHTERAMIVHDKDCRILCDYNPKSEYRGRNTWFYNTVFLVNYWTLRNNDRQIKKYYYSVYQNHQDKDVGCKYKK